MSTALLTADTPRWLFLALVALGIAAHAACGLVSLTSRARRALADRCRTSRPVSFRSTANVRQEAIS